MKSNKTPGDDGLPIEFYRKFWNDLKEIIVKSFNESYAKQNLPESQKRSLISLIHKKGSRLDLQNWRPISLLNHDYKILSMVLAERMKKIISRIIDRDQVGYIKGRYIGENVRTIEDVINYTEGLKLGNWKNKNLETISWPNKPKKHWEYTLDIVKMR